MIKLLLCKEESLEKALSRKCRPYLKQVRYVLKAEGYNNAYCEDLLSNIYHHALSDACENIKQYPIDEAIDLALKKLEPAESYSL